MRLLANKIDRSKLPALIALGVAAGVFGVWFGLYRPISRQMAEDQATISQLETELTQAPEQIRRLGEMREELVETMRGLRVNSEKYLLQPRLGNYLLPARDFLVKRGNDVGAEAIQVSEIGLIDPPVRIKPAPKAAAASSDQPGMEQKTPAAPVAQTNKAPTVAVRVYSTRVVAECGYDAFVEWVRRIQTDNPLIAISHFLITGQPENPQRHLIRFEVQWPVWTDPGTQAEVRQKVAEILSSEVK